MNHVQQLSVTHVAQLELSDSATLPPPPSPNIPLV